MVGQYFVTPLALFHLRDLGDSGRERWGDTRNARYMADLRRAFQYIADHHKRLPDKTRLTGSHRLNVHGVNSHYVVFVVLAPDEIAITSVLHQRMDVAARLAELQARTDNEVGDLRAALLRRNLR